MKLAPIFIGTLNRASHLQACIESLKQSSLATDTHLYIGLDHPQNEEHWEGYGQVNRYLDSLSGFKELTVIKREANIGAVQNFLSGQEQVLNHYDRILITEDDNVFSPNFLPYINQGLEEYESDQRIFALCGHNYPLSWEGVYRGNHYAWQGCSVWGLGIWRNRYQAMHSTVEEFKRCLKNPKKVIQAYRIAPHYVLSMLAKVLKESQFDPFSDAAINLHLREHGQYCVFPTISKARNYGHDGSGLRSGVILGESPFATQEIDTADDFDFDTRGEVFFNNPAVNRALYNYFHRGRAQTVKTILRLVSYYLRGSG